MKFLIMISLLSLSACGAHMENTTRKSTPYAPLNETRGGTVSYYDQGLGSKGRRESAYKKMYDYCQGDYRIVSEGQTYANGSAVPVGGAVLYNQVRKTEIKFECEKQND